MTLDNIPLYAVFADGELVGFSFGAHPGSADENRVHKPLDRADPGAPLLLAAFSRPAEARAFVAGLQYGREDVCGCVVRYFAPDLTCVLAEFFDSDSACGLWVEDMRSPRQQAGAA